MTILRIQSHGKLRVESQFCMMQMMYKLQLINWKNTIIWSDALTLDYSQIASSIGLTKNIGYLSCDIEPPRNTFLALKKVIEEGFVFECITFEHDSYQSKDNYDKISRYN